ncbi:MAG: glycosyltransferase family 4 protein [Gammaproteobacteria bacterium]|nr:glycosyltransferase family 4 protein [Gammaproteobacteria bacterium]MDP2141595.1 glycosyltransferase family 4 protein [Gammaproteobacteria bacterium]MDP2346650.1 glycosyltransferase family 4 protein [Gammaproteobacteria bacterium]
MTTKDCCIFTIVSKNYMHYAINLMASVATFMPEARRVVALCDRPDGLDLQSLPFEVISLEDVNIPHLDKLLVQYSILELNTAIKPFLFSHIFRTAEHAKVIYFDPDIQLFSTGQPLLDTLDRAEIVLTPHLTDFLNDDKQPSEVAILQSGTYNLGFLALSRSDAAMKLLNWWQEKLLRHCIVDIPNGLFTDQKWMDLVPGVFPQSEIVRNAGWNVAYWNLKHRHIEEVTSEDGSPQFLANGVPLFFFHFSGLELGSQRISKHQDRFNLADLTPACQRLFEIYNRCVDDSGRSNYAKMPYAFAKLHSGIRMPDAGRSFLRKTLDWSKPLPDFRTAEGEQLIITQLNTPIDNRRPVVTALAANLYRARPDLIAAFPDMEGIHRLAFVDWFIGNATKQSAIDPVFIAPMLANVSVVTAMPVVGDSVTDETVTRETAPQSAPTSVGKSFYNLLYRIAWSIRYLFRPFFSPQLRHRLRMLLLRKAYHAELTATEQGRIANNSGSVVSSDVHGVNVIGYLNAESGVGESARSMLRALNASDVPHAVVGYHYGNASRQGEQVETDKPSGLHYGVNLFHVNADQIGVARDFLGSEFFGSRYRIGYWAWELGEFPDEWLESFSPLNEIWVPSTFCQKAIANKSPIPVVCIPHTVIIPSTEAGDRARFGLGEDTTCFLSMADMFSIPERKNPLGAVEAFIRAFAGDSRAELIVKLSNSEARPDITAILQRHVAEHSNIHILEGYLSREEVFTLIRSVNCFVSLHRSEGFGLVIAEAMAREKVVIATGWSGNMEFMNGANSLPVDYTLVELQQDYGPYRKGQIWAEPDLDDAAAKMRSVCDNPALRHRIGARAKTDCIELLSDREIGRLVRRRLEAIYRKL